jgi:hypothetical protein
MNGGIKHSFQTLRSSALDSLLSHIAGWASPSPSESSPPLGIFKKFEVKGNEEKNKARKIRTEGFKAA